MDQPPPTSPVSAVPEFVPAPDKPWSGLAIGGFVCSIIGCLPGVSIVGLILGVVGIVQTRGGRRRGFGLAVAAIPISLVTGVLGLTTVFATVAFADMNKAIERLAPLLAAEPATVKTAIANFRDQCTDEFNEHVDDDRFETWWRSIRKQHGPLTALPKMSSTKASGQDYELRFAATRFVNGPASVTVTMRRISLAHFSINDMAVDGVSPRAGTKEPPP